MDSENGGYRSTEHVYDTAYDTEYVYDIVYDTEHVYDSIMIQRMIQSMCMIVYDTAHVHESE
jgi:hypothetical protein